MALLLAVAGLLVAGAVAGVAVVGQSSDRRPSVEAVAGDGAIALPEVERPARPTGAGAPELVVPAPSPPARVVIPGIGVASDLEDLAMGDDGKLRAPVDYRVAGWFAAGTQPGQPGPAVIAGHVDSPDGPAVFARLAELAPGDEVLVDRADGSQVRFRVTGVESYPKEQFPTAGVYGPVPGAELRLVTCDGAFDRSIGHYLDNLVVYAVVDGTPVLG
ncbi:MAG TPA: class F sortase [Acidimicrobiales bacterium]|nr:class F sortase [Acidimicrobiales bacterium]